MTRYGKRNYKRIGCCGTLENTHDLTGGIGPDRNWCCRTCGAHMWQGRVYDRKEWADYIKEVK